MGIRANARAAAMALVSFLIASQLISSPAFAQSSEIENNNETKAKVDDVNGSSNKVLGEDVDEILTNNKLRAESGSKSRYSVATQFNYDGGSIDKPFAAVRPNIQETTDDTAFADLNGQINAKYNITQRDSILLGGGLQWITPIQGSRPTGYNGNVFNVFDPSINYQRVYKVFGLQSYYQVGPTVYSRTNYINAGYIANLGIYNVNAYDIGQTRFTVGLESSAGYNIYRSGAPNVAGQTAFDVESGESDLSFYFYPYLEYKLTDKLNLRTVSFLVSYDHTRTDVWEENRPIQSVGLGISVTRDIFLYPNLQFVPAAMRADQTNVGLSADVNVF